MVWSAPLSEKKLVSPEKKAPLTGSFSSAGTGAEAGAGSKAVAAWKEEGSLAGCDSQVGAVAGALHQASLVPPAADAISAVSAGVDEGCSPPSDQIDWIAGADSGSGAVPGASCGQTGAGQAGS